MPVITTCPDCDKKLKVPDDLLGKKVKCPGCSKMFTADEDSAGGGRPSNGKGRDGGLTSRPAPPLPKRREDDDDDRPRSRGRRDDDDDDRDRGRGRDRDDDRDRDRDRDRGRDRDRDDDRDRDRGRPRRDDDDYDRGRDRGRGRDDDYDDRDRDRGRGRYDDPPPRNLKKAYQGVSFALSLCQYGGWTLLGALAVLILFSILGMLLAYGGAYGAMLYVGFIVYAILGVASFAGVALILTGMGLCLQAPSERGHPTWGMALAAFICAAAPIVLASVVAFAAGFGLFIVNGAINGFVTLAALILWCLFLKNLCEQVRDTPTGAKAMTWMVVVLIAGGVEVVLMAIAIATAGAAAFGAIAGGNQVGAQLGGIFMMIVMFVILATNVALSIWHIMLLGQVRQTIEAAARKK